MARRALPALLAAAVAAPLAGGLAACGSGDGGKDAGPLAARPPAAIVEAVADALRDVRSYRISGTSIDDEGRTRVTAAVRDDGSVRATYVTNGSTVSFVVTGGRGYLRGDLAYWREARSGVSPRFARALAGHWVRVPGTGLVKEVARLMPDELAHCTTRQLGTLTVTGRRTFRGRPVVGLRDAGNVPGGAPGELLVALDGPPLPVLERQTGPTRPGGTFDPRCDDRDDTTTSSRTTVSYEPVPPIAPPPGAVDPRQLLPRGRPAPALPGSGLSA